MGSPASTVPTIQEAVTVEVPKIRVVIIDDNPSTVDNLRKLLGFEPDMEVVGTALNAESAIEEVRRLTPDVVLMDVNMPGQDGIKATQTMASQAPYPPVVLMSVQEDREYLRRAMQAGAREFLVKPFSADELAAALRRVNQLEKLKRVRVPPPVPPVEDGSPARERKPGRVILVFSGKGGTGKSLMAVNIAAAMARDLEGRTCLVDFDLQFGDIGVLLGLESGRNVFQVVEAFPNIDDAFIEALMPEATGGFRVLLGPQSPEFADLVTAEHARAILEILQAAFDHVIVDTSSHLGEVTLEALERASQIVLLVDLSVPAVKEAKLALRVFQRLGIQPDRIKVVLNRADSNLGITLQQVETSLEVKIAARLPSDHKLVLKSVQRGEPFVSLFPNEDLSQKVRELASTLVPLHAADGSPASRLNRRRSFWKSSAS
ncbi:MAG: AAA family ATPase [Candidatus Dormibacteraceae bacterium]